VRLREGYRFVDWATQGYLLLVAVVAVAVHRGHWLALVGLHLAALVAVHALVRIGRRPKAPPWLRWLRDFYPILLYFGFYAETWVVNRMTGAARLDPWLMRADQAVFGCQPAEAFMAVCSQPWLGELLHASYLSFYLMVGGVGFWLSVRNRRAFGHFVTVVSLVFYACYAIYLFVPAVGPRVLYADTPERAQFFATYGQAPRPVPAALEAGPAYRVLDLIERHAEIAGAAFPSSHVTIAFVTAWFSWRYLRAIRWPHLLLALSICGSTVYTRAHYGVDVLAGLLAAAVLLPAAEAAYRRWGWTEGPGTHPAACQAPGAAASSRP
jgi:membrane-associated phospholipid phosphatase